MSMDTIAQSRDENAIARKVELLKTALIDADSASLHQLTHEELSYGHSSGRVEDKPSLIESLTSRKSDFVSIDISDQSIQVSGKTAIVRHTFLANTNDGGKPGTVKLAILLVWQKKKNDWKLLARQAVRL